MAQDVWLDATEMASAAERSASQSRCTKRDVSTGTAQLRCYSRTIGLRLLCGSVDDVPEDATYLVWVGNCDEPEVWDYAGYDFHSFKNLADFLTWTTERD